MKAFFSVREEISLQGKWFLDGIFDGSGMELDFRNFTHGKPLAIPEWGLVSSENGHGGLDNVLFIERMKAFITDPANNVAWHCYFDVNAPDHHHQVSPGVGEHGQPEKTEFPRAAARFVELFGGHAK